MIYQTIAWRPALRKGRIIKLLLQVDESYLLDLLGERAVHSKRGFSQHIRGAVRVIVRKPSARNHSPSWD